MPRGRGPQEHRWFARRAVTQASRRCWDRGCKLEALCRPGASFAATLAVLLISPQLASAAARIATGWHPCPKETTLDAGAHWRCAEVEVPLDRSGAVAGTVRLFVAWRHLPGKPRPAVVALAGGPGDPALPLLERTTSVLEPLSRGRDIIVFDQRGTGRSGFLRCPALDNSGTVADCAAQLGARAGLYSTDDTVHDLEEIRQALGVPVLHLYGVSYGTVTAQAYARSYRPRVASMILDSPFKADDLDPLFVDSFAAVRRILGRLCADGACRGITRDPQEDLRRVVALAERGGLRARLPTGRQRRIESASMTTRELLLWLLRQSYEPQDIATVPALLAAAARGDAEPLLRHRRLATELRAGTAGSASAAAYWAAWCTDVSSSEHADVGGDAFAPFPLEAAMAVGNATRCSDWGAAARIPSTPLHVPRTLLLVGELDMVTPVETATRMRRAFGRQARLEVIPGASHDVLGTPRPCVRRILAEFVSRSVPRSRCGRVNARLLPGIPTRSADLPGATPVDRLLAAVDATLSNVEHELRDYLIFIGGGWAGLRGGWAKGIGPFSDSIAFHGYRLVQDVSIHGVVRWDRSARRLARGQMSVRYHGVRLRVVLSRRVLTARRVGDSRRRTRPVATYQRR